MNVRNKKNYARKGIAMLAAMMFLAIFAALSIGFLSLSSANTQISANQQAANKAMNAALSGLDCAKYVINLTNTISPLTTNSGTASASDSNSMWSKLATQLSTVKFGNLALQTATATSISTGTVPSGDNGTFQINFTRAAAGALAYQVEVIGTYNSITRTIRMTLNVDKNDTILRYGIAGRGRVWVTGDTTVYGGIYSTYGKKSTGSLINMAPFNMTSDSSIRSSLFSDGSLYSKGTASTILSKAEIDSLSYQLETLNSDGNPLYEFTSCVYDCEGNAITPTYGIADDNGNLLYETVDGDLAMAYDENGQIIMCDYNNRVYSSADELQGYHEGALYSQPVYTDLPGLNINDYDTSSYKTTVNYTSNACTTTSGGVTTISNGKLLTTGVPYVTEYFPHAAGSYTTKASTSSLTLKRYKYESKTLSNVFVPAGTHALFKDCKFNGVLYIDCTPSGPTASTPSTYNNIRFENCTFNGTVITNVPKALNSNWWMANCLYFTGTATFQNTSNVKEATILAPHFNVNMGNTNPTTGDTNTLTGVIVGGIVDVRGNADIRGTIISMADTSSYTSGYVTNIGATENDGGSETTEAGDIGTITIDPAKNTEKNLPNGITTPVTLVADLSTYQESI